MKSALRSPLCAMALFLTVAACGAVERNGDPAHVTFAPSLGVDLAKMTKTSSGLYYRDLAPGTGTEAGAGSTVTVQYTGWLTSGSQFDTGSFSFTIGEHGVVAGFEEGVTGMKVGAVRQLVIPASLGYGAQGKGPIPGNAVMVFQLSLKKVG